MCVWLEDFREKLLGPNFDSGGPGGVCVCNVDERLFRKHRYLSIQVVPITPLGGGHALSFLVWTPARELLALAPFWVRALGGWSPGPGKSCAGSGGRGGEGAGSIDVRLAAGFPRKVGRLSLYQDFTRTLLEL